MNILPTSSPFLIGTFLLICRIFSVGKRIFFFFFVLLGIVLWILYSALLFPLTYLPLFPLVVAFKALCEFCLSEPLGLAYHSRNYFRRNVTPEYQHFQKAKQRQWIQSPTQRRGLRVGVPLLRVMIVNSAVWCKYSSERST